MCASPHTAGLARERRRRELENLGRLVQSRGTFSIFHVGEFHESHEVGSVLETRQKSRTRERMFSCVFPKNGSCMRVPEARVTEFGSFSVILTIDLVTFAWQNFA